MCDAAVDARRAGERVRDIFEVKVALAVGAFDCADDVVEPPALEGRRRDWRREESAKTSLTGTGAGTGTSRAAGGTHCR